MYIIPTEKRKRIEKDVKTQYLKEIDTLVKEGIQKAQKMTGAGKKFSWNVGWYDKIERDLLNPQSAIYYRYILEVTPEKLIWIYRSFQRNYPEVVRENGKDYRIFGDKGLNTAKNIKVLTEIRSFFATCFPYKTFSEKGGTGYDAYEFCKSLDIKVCVYCNAQMTHTVSEGGNKIVRPQIDHYYPKSKFPMFALSFYNLIPACPTCNSIKSDQDMDVKTMYHPYMDTELPVRFRMVKKAMRMDFQSAKAVEMKKILKTKEIYDIYEAEAVKIHEKATDFGKVYMDDLLEVMNKYREKSPKWDKCGLIKRLFDFVPKEETFEIPLGELKHDIQRSVIKKEYGINIK